MARAQASALAARLRALGAEVVEAPVIRVEPLPVSVPALGGYDLLCLTSPNGVHRLFEQVRDARALAGKIGIAAVVLGATFLVWTMLAHGDWLVWVVGLLTAVALLAGLYANFKGREGWAFGLLGGTMVGVVATLFAAPARHVARPVAP